MIEKAKRRCEWKEPSQEKTGKKIYFILGINSIGKTFW